MLSEPRRAGGWTCIAKFTHDVELDRLTEEQAPKLRAAFGIGTDTAAACPSKRSRSLHSQSALKTGCYPTRWRPW